MGLSAIKYKIRTDLNELMRIDKMWTPYEDSCGDKLKIEGPFNCTDTTAILTRYGLKTTIKIYPKVQ